MGTVQTDIGAWLTPDEQEAWRAFLHDLYTGWGDRWEAPRIDLPRGKIPEK